MEKVIKVLLVDDEADFIRSMAFWLNSKGYTTLTASDGKAALEVIKNDKPDIVFLDLNMPVMDGPGTLREIRKSHKGLPVIIISAFVEDQGKIKQVSDCGISGIFYKGKDFSEGLSLLESALRTHKELKQK